MYYLLKWIKFSVKKNKTLKNTGKMAKNTGKVREKSGNFVSPEKWEPCMFDTGLLCFKCESVHVGVRQNK